MNAATIAKDQWLITAQSTLRGHLLQLLPLHP
jgi:hypothetical protein